MAGSRPSRAALIVTAAWRRTSSSSSPATGPRVSRFRLPFGAVYQTTNAGLPVRWIRTDSPGHRASKWNTSALPAGRVRRSRSRCVRKDIGIASVSGLGSDQVAGGATYRAT